MSIDELVGGPDRRTAPLIARGQVVRAPADNDAEMSVVVENYSGKLDFEVPGEQWTSQPGVLPLDGDVCVVLFDDDGDAWVPSWEGSGQPTLIAEGDAAGGDLTGTYPDPTLAASAVGAAELDVEVVTDAASAPTTSTGAVGANQEITGISITVSKTGLYVVICTWDWLESKLGTNVCVGYLYKNGVAYGDVATWGVGANGAHRATITQTWHKDLVAGDVLTMRHNRTANVGDVVAQPTHTKMVLMGAF